MLYKLFLITGHIIAVSDYGVVLHSDDEKKKYPKMILKKFCDEIKSLIFFLF